MKNSPPHLFQYIGTALALLISTSALLVSIYEANLLRSEQRALVWPYLKVGGSFSGNGYSFVATNNGTGPAIVKSVEVRYEGEVITNYDDLLDRINPDRNIGYDRLRMSNLNQTVLKAGEERVIFNMPWDEETRQMAFKLHKAHITVQYCSVLEECWIYNSQTNTHTKGEFQSQKEFGN